MWKFLIPVFQWQPKNTKFIRRLCTNILIYSLCLYRDVAIQETTCIATGKVHYLFFSTAENDTSGKTRSPRNS